MTRRTVYLVQRDNIDGLYGFEWEHQADAYAALFPGADTGTLNVLDRAAGARLIDAEAAERKEVE